jgi:general secretion pathway protein H
LLKDRPRPIKVGKAISRGAQGFTLLEMVVVLAIMALLLGLVMPNLYGSIKRERERANLRHLITVLRLARSQAATTQRRVRVFLNRETGRYRLEGSSRQGVLTGMHLRDTALVWQDPEHHQGYIAFYGDGTSSGGKVIMRDAGGRRYDLEVEVITGRVTLTTGEEKT